MNAIYINPNNPEEIDHVFSKIEENKNIQSVLFLMADKNHYGNDELQQILNNSSKDIIGGIFPEIIFEGKRKQEGVLIITMEVKMKSLLIDLNSPNIDVLDKLSIKFGQLENIFGTLFVFCDAFAKNKNRFLESLFNYFGINVTYLGGGAGSLSFQSSPCIINNKGIHQDMATIALIPDVKSIGVAHGWLPITDPMKVTKAIGNKVVSINWQPAFSLYKKIVEAHSKQTFTNNNFFDIAKSYPLGIAVMDTEMVIRDPFMVEDNDMHIVDIVQEGEHISIMHGNMESLLNGAEAAKNQAFNSSSLKEENIFCIDCISRVLFMESDFQKELSIIQGNGNINGILSIGEIANSGDSYLEIFNKTVVVAKW